MAVPWEICFFGIGRMDMRKVPVKGLVPWLFISQVENLRC